MKQAEFDGVEFDCYVEPDQDDKGAFWATREQIGRLLEYEYPREAIGKIHQRNQERLDKFSSEVKLTTEAGMRITTVYNFKGLLEICRYSNQPKANAVIDWLWDVADEIRRTGSYTLKKKRKAAKKSPSLTEIMNVAEKIYHKALHCECNDDVQEVLSLDETFRNFAGESALEIAHFKLKNEDDSIEKLRLEFKHPELEKLREENRRMRKMCNDPEYLVFVEEYRHRRK